MTKRSYRQHCALARTLDLVGERWMLLLVRDLLAGPKRYKDLLRGLPGIGTNLLAVRLKQLVESGLAIREQDQSAPVYRLTDEGRELEPALIALARFGMSRLGTKGPDDLWLATWTTLAMEATFRADRAAGVDECYEFCIDQETFHARVREGLVTTAAGPGEQPAFTLTTDGETFLALASGELEAETTLATGQAQFVGEPAALARSLEIFGLGTSA